uniref:Glycoside hydrolase family 19 catalytic domain-containing protein n=1 Tax=Parascaris univalens TaxID=6257 RepID=A0A915AI28_PARUN
FISSLLIFLFYVTKTIDASFDCPPQPKYGTGPPPSCAPPSDPNNLPPSELESWFTKDMFEDLFPYANIGWGPNECWPYSYEAFVIAARYFPGFGTSSPNNVYTKRENTRRDLAAFFAQALQETGANDASLFGGGRTVQEANDCFYRGGFYNWFEGGPVSSFLSPHSPGYQPIDGSECNVAGTYCSSSPEINYWYPCEGSTEPVDGYYTGCYFGRGALQISYNYNYGQFENWLRSRGIIVNLLAEPNLVLTKMDPPLAVLASLWFYMTPQPPKPAMHDIVIGLWNPGPVNKAAGYTGPIFGPTSLIINNECGGEDASNPGGPGESRRIKAFKWFCSYFGVPYGEQRLLSCKDMPQKFDMMRYNLSYQPDWSSTWKPEPCKCAPASYAGIIPYFDPDYYPEEFVELNEENLKRCVLSVYENPSMYGMIPALNPCLEHDTIEGSGID